MLLFIVCLSNYQCDHAINVSTMLQTYRIDVVPQKKFCVNMNLNQTYLLFTNGSKSYITIESYDYDKKNYSTNTSAIKELQSKSFYTLYHPTKMIIYSDTDDIVEFIAVKFPSPCYNGYFFSSHSKSTFNFTAEGQPPYSLTNYDNKCVLLYGSSNSSINVSYNIEEKDSLTIYTLNSNKTVNGTISSDIYKGTSVAIYFQSDFSILSEYIKINSESTDPDTAIADSGSFMIPKQWIIPDSTPETIPPPKSHVNTALIISITVISCLAAGTIVFLLVYCLVCVKKSEPPKNTDTSIIDKIDDESIDKNLV